jgi:1,2-phenylacetyl-CoA epoxidase catalytic subunit
MIQPQPQASTLQPATANTRQTSAQALDRIGLPGLKQLQDKLHDICVAAQRNGIDDLSGKEIQARYELQYGQRIEASSVASRVNNLVTAGRLERVKVARPCKVTGRDIHPVRVPMKQVRLVA